MRCKTLFRLRLADIRAGMDAEEDGPSIPEVDILRNLAEGDSYWGHIGLPHFRSALVELQRAGVLQYAADGMVGTTLLKRPPPIT